MGVGGAEEVMTTPTDPMMLLRLWLLLLGLGLGLLETKLLLLELLERRWLMRSRRRGRRELVPKTREGASSLSCLTTAKRGRRLLLLLWSLTRGTKEGRRLLSLTGLLLLLLLLRCPKQPSSPSAALTREIRLGPVHGFVGRKEGGENVSGVTPWCVYKSGYSKDTGTLEKRKRRCDADET